MNPRSRQALAMLLHALSVAVLVVVLTFLLVRIVPGDPVETITGSRGTEEARAALRAQLDLDRSMPRQFGSFVSHLVRGDLGESLLQQRRPVSEIISEKLPVTLSVVGFSLLLSCAVGIPVGMWAAVTGRRGLDVTIRSVLAVLLSLPPFFFGLLLLLGPGGSWRWLPAGGWGGGWPENFRYVLLPAVALSAYLTPLIARTVRQTAIETEALPFVEAAITRGVSRRRVTFRHTLPNSLLPVIALVALNAGALIAGSVVVEAVFALPGIGQELVTAVARRDYPIIQGIALVSALTVVASNLLGDVLSLMADPRAKR